MEQVSAGRPRDRSLLTGIDMLQRSLTKIPTIVDFISRTEQGLLNRQSDLSNSDVYLSEKALKISNSNYRVEKQPLEASTKHSTRWCKYHRSGSHDNSECLSQRQLKSQTNGASSPKGSLNKEVKNYLIRDKTPKFTLLEYFGHLNGTSANFIIDTGAEGNFISHTLAKKLNLYTSNLAEKETITYGNGCTEKTNKIVEILFEILELPSIKFKDTFSILQNLNPETVILGAPFLTKQSVKIDYGQSMI